MKTELTKQEKIFLYTCLEKLEKGKHTPFLNPRESSFVISQCKKHQIFYREFRPYPEAEKVLLYQDEIGVNCYCLKGSEPLSHSQILGSLFSHQIANETFGDIIVTESCSYIYILDHFASYFEQYFTKVGKVPISFKKVDLHMMCDYHPLKENKNYTVSSLRFDVVVSSITGYSRKKVQQLLLDQMILYQYQVVTKGSFEIEENSIFSIRRFGKYQLKSIDGKTRSGKHLITVSKYV